MRGFLGITIFWAGDLLFDALWEPLSAWSRILSPLAILAFLVWRSWVAFEAQGALLGKKNPFVIGLANCITLCRGFLVCGMGGFICSSQLQGFSRWIPSISYASVIAADGLDGWIARSRKEGSPVGEVLDCEVDALGTFVAAMLCYQYGRLPAFYVAVGGAYYIFSLAVWLRTKHGKPVHPLKPDRIRRSVGSLQALSLIILLSPLLGPAEGFLFAIVLTLIVSASFLRDWMAVVGPDWMARWGRGLKLR